MEKNVAEIVLLGLTMVNELRKGTDLRYVYTGPRTGKRGAPRKYDGRLYPKNPDLGRMERVDGLCGEEEGEHYTQKQPSRKWARTSPLVNMRRSCTAL